MTVLEMRDWLLQFPADWKVKIEMVQKDLNEENVFQGDELEANNIYCAGQGEVCISI